MRKDLQRLLRDVVILIGAMTASVVVCGTIVILSTVAYCEQLKQFPTPIKYPESQLVNKSLDGKHDYSVWKNLFNDSAKPPAYVTYRYESVDKPDKIYDFYVAQGAHRFDFVEQVEGRLDGAEYTVFATWNERREITRYTIIISRDACY